MRRRRERSVHGQTVNPDACESRRGRSVTMSDTPQGDPKTSKTRAAGAGGNTSHDNGKSSMPEDEGVMKAPVLSGRDFGAAAVTEWRCDKGRGRRPATVRGPERGCAVACSDESPAPGRL